MNRGKHDPVVIRLLAREEGRRHALDRRSYFLRSMIDYTMSMMTIWSKELLKVDKLNGESKKKKRSDGDAKGDLGGIRVSPTVNGSEGIFIKSRFAHTWEDDFLRILDIWKIGFVGEQNSVSIIFKMKSNVFKGNIFHFLQLIFLFEGNGMQGRHVGFDNVGIWRLGICWFFEMRVWICWFFEIVSLGIQLFYDIVIQGVNNGFDITTKYLLNIRLAKWNCYKRTSGNEIREETREEGEIKSAGEEALALVSKEFQAALAETQAAGLEVISDPVDGEEGLQKIQSLLENDRAPEGEVEDVMEMDKIQAALLEHGLDMNAIDALPAAGEQANGEDEKNKDATEQDKKQGTRKRLFKPSINVAGSTKMRIAAALVSPRKRAAAKMGTRKGDTNKPLESKGPSNPNSGNLKN
ncbi:hypothetical protein HID58_066693 [Brassica napus]|uniref:Uncharacterized protein n=1 Tax=Brassica napus TaxID=3708 RepID=A0ABQ7ZGD3_BRANA|nr:hypothetical protein HID58_066693 [Brassica napus]